VRLSVLPVISSISTNSTFILLSICFHSFILPCIEFSSSKGLRSRSTSRGWNGQQITCKPPENFISRTVFQRNIWSIAFDIDVDVDGFPGNRSLQSQQIAFIQFYNSKTICASESPVAKRRECQIATFISYDTYVI